MVSSNVYHCLRRKHRCHKFDAVCSRFHVNLWSTDLRKQIMGLSYCFDCIISWPFIELYHHTVPQLKTYSIYLYSHSLHTLSFSRSLSHAHSLSNSLSHSLQHIHRHSHSLSHTLILFDGLSSQREWLLFFFVWRMSCKYVSSMRDT